jgi:hypothetical protein
MSLILKKKCKTSNQHILIDGQLINSNDEVNNKEGCLEFNFVYLAHPRAITSISWRQISKFMPRLVILEKYNST